MTFRLIFVTLASIVCVSVTADDVKSKAWKSSDGKFGLTSVTPSKVVLFKTSDHKQFEGTWLKLPLALRKEISAYWAQQDREQLDKVRKAIAANRGEIKGIYDQLKTLHVEYTMSPYAGMALGVSYAGLLNDPDKATVILKQVISRLETQRGASPDAHSSTLASCYCDLAICALKDKKADIGLGFLVRSLDTLPMKITLHNANQLATISKSPGTYFKLTDAQHAKLAKMLEDLDTSTEKFELGWHYSLAVDEPGTAASTSYVGNLGLEPPVADYKIIDVNLGVNVNEGTLVFPSSICMTGINTSVLLSYYVPGQTSKQPKPLNEVFVEVESGSSEFRSSLTRFKPVSRASNRSLSLAACQLEAGIKGSVRFLESNPIVNDPIQVLTLDRTAKQDVAFKSIQNSIKSYNSAKVIELKEKNFVGLSGSPLFTKEGEFLGFMSNKSTPATLTSAPEIKVWFERAIKTKFNNASAPGLAGVVAIVSWSPNNETTDSVALSPGQGQLSKVVRDEWCVPCGGKGFFKCPNCIKGVASFKDVEATGTNPLTQLPIFSTVVKQKPCDACNARGGFDCPHCVDGHLGQ